MSLCISSDSRSGRPRRQTELQSMEPCSSKTPHEEVDCVLIAGLHPSLRGWDSHNPPTTAVYHGHAAGVDYNWEWRSTAVKTFLMRIILLVLLSASTESFLQPPPLTTDVCSYNAIFGALDKLRGSPLNSTSVLDGQQGFTIIANL